MKLTEQFPDISAKIRARNKNRQQGFKSVNANQPMSYGENEAVTKYYEGRFRRWHMMLIFILGTGIGIFVYTILSNSEWFQTILSWSTI